MLPGLAEGGFEGFCEPGFSVVTGDEDGGEGWHLGVDGGWVDGWVSRGAGEQGAGSRGNWELGIRLGFEVGSGIACGEPDEGADDVADGAELVFGGAIGGDDDRGEGNAVTAENDGGDRLCPGHVVVGGDQVDVMDVLAIQILNQGGEVGYGVGGAIVQINTIGGDACFVKETMGISGR